MADPNDSQAMRAGRLAALGTEFGVAIVAGVFLGYYIDEWLGTTPLFLLLLSLGAFAGSIYRMIVMLRRWKT